MRHIAFTPGSVVANADHREKQFGDAMVGELRIVWSDYATLAG
jgi:hypothetical protein